MKLISCYTKSHQKLVDEWFRPSLRDEFDLELHLIKGVEGGAYMEEGWSEGVKSKSDTIIQAIKDNWGEVIIYTDVDMQFFGSIKSLFEKAILENDIVLQRDNPNGNFCSGLFVARCNEKVLQLWQSVRKAVDQEGRDQLAFNRIIRSMEGIRYDHLPVDKIFGGGTFLAQIWEPGVRLHIPREPLIHHANWVLGIENKIEQLKYVKETLRVNRPSLKRVAVEPKISVVTPVFNGEKVIEECLLNVIDQNCPQAEHVIVDDGSTDGTEKILKSYAKEYPHIRYISQKNQGQSHAMNKGIKMARGKIIGTLNDDDFYEPGVLSRVISLAQEQPEPLFLVGNCKIWDNEGNLKTINRPHRLKLDELLLGFDINPFPVNPSAYFYSKSLHEKIGYYDVAQWNYYAMDLDLLLKAAKEIKLHHIDDEWGNFRIYEETKTYSEMKSGRSLAQNNVIMESFIRELPVIRQIKIRIIRSLFMVKQRISYYLARLKYYLQTPHEFRSLIKRKLGMANK